jgi:hypothetical protein
MREIFVFHVRLAEVTPVIWRRLEIRAEQTFWALHCAIQDAMPWDDKHLHEFRFPSGDEETRIGLPDLDDEKLLASWDTPLRDWFTNVAAQCKYLYDFGDGWAHVVTLEARSPAEPGGKYPRCTGGERRSRSSVPLVSARPDRLRATGTRRTPGRQACTRIASARFQAASASSQRSRSL